MSLKINFSRAHWLRNSSTCSSKVSLLFKLIVIIFILFGGILFQKLTWWMFLLVRTGWYFSGSTFYFQTTKKVLYGTVNFINFLQLQTTLCISSVIIRITYYNSLSCIKEMLQKKIKEKSDLIQLYDLYVVFWSWY